MAIYTHIILGANDLDAANKFYGATLATLGIKNLGTMGDAGNTLYGVDTPELGIVTPANGEPATFANGGTVGFHAATREAVRQFHAAGLANGGTDEGQPGPRTFTPTAYAAYLRDPTGNKICAYCFADGE